MVLGEGLEPSRLTAPEPKSGVSANFTTRAYVNSGGRTQNRTADTRIFSPLLYQLSYPATLEKGGIKIVPIPSVN